MTRDELLEQLMLDTGIKTKGTAERTLDAMINGIVKGLQEDGEVQLTFGKFKKVDRAARMGRNPQTGEEIQIPAKTVVKFYASKTLKADIQDPDVEDQPDD